MRILYFIFLISFLSILLFYVIENKSKIYEIFHEDDNIDNNQEFELEEEQVKMLGYSDPHYLNKVNLQRVYTHITDLYTTKLLINTTTIIEKCKSRRWEPEKNKYHPKEKCLLKIYDDCESNAEVIKAVYATNRLTILLQQDNEDSRSNIQTLFEGLTKNINNVVNGHTLNITKQDNRAIIIENMNKTNSILEVYWHGDCKYINRAICCSIPGFELSIIKKINQPFF
jgi:hypothetical protein